MSKPNILILGTDAAGKNYLGQLLLKHITEAGVACAFRERRLSGRDNGGLEKEKSIFGHMAEWAFVSSYPLLKPLMPHTVNILLQLDLALAKPSTDAQIIVSHNALRLAAFDLGHRCNDVREVKIPETTENLLKQLKNRHNGDVVVLDIAHETRQKRVNARGESSDPFDRYLAARPELSERIEACMVMLACEYLDASLIENDALSEAELLDSVAQASAKFSARIQR